MIIHHNDDHTGVEGTEGVATEGAEVASDIVTEEREGKEPEEPETTAA